MKIILKEDIELYRYLIAKATFLQTHKEYRLVESFLDSNCFLVANRKTKEKVFVSLFKQPTKEPADLECKKVVYIQNANTKIPEGFDVEKADKEFNDQLAKNIRLGFHLHYSQKISSLTSYTREIFDLCQHFSGVYT